MKARKQLLAAGSTVTLVAGGAFFAATPAAAVHESPECLTAQSQFTAALNNAGITADLEVQLAVALQNLIDAQETRDLLTVEGTLTLAEVEALIAPVLADAKLNIPELPAIQALINANASADSAVGDARALLDASIDGSLDQATLEALAAAGIEPETFLLAQLLDETGLNAAVDAAVDAGTTVDSGRIEALRTDINDGDEVLSDASLATLTELNIDVQTFTTFDAVVLGAALDAIVTVSEQEATLALIAALQTGDTAAILEAEAALEALVGENVDLTVLAGLFTELLAAQAVLEAEADLAAAVAVVEGLLVQLEGLDIDLLELEALFNAAIDACTEAGAVGGVGTGGGTGTGTGGGAGTTGGGTGSANRGMNVQTAAATAETDPAGIGVLAAGLGFMVVAGTLAARRVRNS
ncbi:hypothetical protein [Arthrobacter sp. 35/47]|uniref:hypothetical protein n=1 Tax=Arthrobacter sp. 35/47 TaxID=269454 RepID=UPI00047DAA9A|nr:hypothetical protein [Arthrobacter sp. 35/47]